MLSPVWDEFAEKAEAEFGPNTNFVIGKIDCDKESKWPKRTSENAKHLID